MKKAPILGLVALGLFLAVVAVSKEAEQPDTVVPLDMRGIDTLVVRGTAGEVIIDGTKPATVAYRAFVEHEFDVQREESTLIVTLRGDDAENLTLVVPPTLRLIEARHSSVEAKSPVDAIELRASGAITWKGPVRALRVRQLRGQRCGANECSGLYVQVDGRVESLAAEVWEGSVRLQAPDKLGRAALALGPKAAYSFDDAHVPVSVSVSRLDRDALPRPQFELKDRARP